MAKKLSLLERNYVESTEAWFAEQKERIEDCKISMQAAMKSRKCADNIARLNREQIRVFKESLKIALKGYNAWRKSKSLKARRIT